MDSISRKMARFALSLTFDQIPEPARVEAKRFLLDSVGCALAALDHEDMRQAYEYVEGLGGREQASIIGHGTKTNLGNAALLNALLIRAFSRSFAQSSRASARRSTRTTCRSPSRENGCCTSSCRSSSRPPR